MSEPGSGRWEMYKRDVLAALAAVQFAPVYGGLENAKPSGDGWMLASCPLHEDANPSFGFSLVTGAWSCFAGCGQGDAFGFLIRHTGKSFREVLLGLGDQLGLPQPTECSGNEAALVAYDYRDETGALLYQVVRGPDKGFWQRRPGEHGGWIKSLGDTRRVLYRLPELTVRPDETVFVVEGEKDADRMYAVDLLATTNSGGAGKWKPEFRECLRGRNVVILPDNDMPGRDHATQVARELQGIAASVKIVELPDLPPKGDVSDWLDAGHTIAELQNLVGRAAAEGPGSEGNPLGLRPVIVVNGRQLIEVIDEAWLSLLAQNDLPRLFVSSGQLARLVNESGGLIIQPLNEDTAFGMLLRSADWAQRRGDSTLDAKPPKDIARDILANPHPDLPQLESVAATPVFDEQWRLLSAPGYHPESRLWLQLTEDPDTYDLPLRPTPEDLASARALLVDDLLVDFPFTADSDRAHAVAAIILPFARRMFSGPSPIHLIEASTPGSGKSLLAELVSIIARGFSQGCTTLTSNEDETRKKLTAILCRGAPVISIDNLQGGLWSAQIAAAITAEEWEDRILGRTQMVTLPNRALWLVSANNPNLSAEIARRCIRIRLNPSEEQPWTRTGFKHDPIREWTKLNRPALVRAVLTTIRSWIAAGAPQGTQKLGSFETWAGVIGGMVTHLGLPGFLDDTGEFYAAADLESGEWRTFVQAWHARFGTASVGVRELMALADEKDLIGFAYVSKSETGQRMRLGRALTGLRDRKFGDLRVVIGGDSNRKVHQYRLVQVGGDLFSGKEGP